MYIHLFDKLFPTYRSIKDSDGKCIVSIVTRRKIISKS